MFDAASALAKLDKLRDAGRITLVQYDGMKQRIQRVAGPGGAAAAGSSAGSSSSPGGDDLDELEDMLGGLAVDFGGAGSGSSAGPVQR